jgi:hypothetical protein
MKPVGLTLKKDGELMIVHLCLNCGKISCNRIAGDDNPYIITCLLEAPSTLSKEITTGLTSQSIMLLNQDDKKDVLTALYGYGYLKS